MTKTKKLILRKVKRTSQALSSTCLFTEHYLRSHNTLMSIRKKNVTITIVG